jgi:hypothetical protein
VIDDLPLRIVEEGEGHTLGRGAPERNRPLPCRQFEFLPPSPKKVLPHAIDVGRAYRGLLIVRLGVWRGGPAAGPEILPPENMIDLHRLESRPAHGQGQRSGTEQRAMFVAEVLQGLAGENPVDARRLDEEGRATVGAQRRADGAEEADGIRDMLDRVARHDHVRRLA